MLKDKQNKLATCDERLQTLIKEYAKNHDVQVICGYRSPEEQQKAFDEGKSRARPGKSAHGLKPARAVDIAPLPLDWNDREAFSSMQYQVRLLASTLGIRLKPVILWDLVHIELK